MVLLAKKKYHRVLTIDVKTCYRGICLESEIEVIEGRRRKSTSVVRKNRVRKNLSVEKLWRRESSMSKDDFTVKNDGDDDDDWVVTGIYTRKRRWIPRKRYGTQRRHSTAVDVRVRVWSRVRASLGTIAVPTNR